MKILDESFKAALAAESTNLTWCWLIEQINGEKLGFTSFDLMLLIDGVEYQPFSGFAPSADENAQGLERKNSQSLGGIITTNQISSTDLINGKYENARITCFIVNVVDLPNTLQDDPPKFLLKYTRTIAKVAMSDRGFTLETRDLDYQLRKKLGKQTSKFCNHDLGDSGCGVDLTNYTFMQVITGVANRFIFQLSGDFVSGQFDRGTITFISGENAGITRDVATFDGTTIQTFQPFPYIVALGDNIILIQGCGKTLFDCIVRYNNVVNSDSEPHIPTIEQATT